MVARGSLGKYTPGPPSKAMFTAVVGILAVYSVLGGYLAGTQPTGAGWRLFSWHPFLMMVGMMGFMGSAAMIKKLGGYTNTKMHGILSWLGIMCSAGGMYAIYKNKENHGSQHWTTTHALAGLACIFSCIGLGLVGGIVLHPDFGIDKTNKTIRLVHKFSARIVLILAWFTAFMGLNTLTQEPMALLMFAVPLLMLVPVTLM